MKFSESLAAGVRRNLRSDSTELVERLTMAGLKIESAEPVAAEFTRRGRCASEGGRSAIRTRQKLSVCRVWDGSAEYQVVCGAANVRAGLVTAFARVGAQLPGGVKIAKSKLRGVESNGMLCSAAELGIGDDADGIMDLVGDYRPGDALRDALQLDDVSLDVELTPNRGDCLSIRGMAREAGVLFQEHVAQPIVRVVAATDRRYVSGAHRRRRGVSALSRSGDSRHRYAAANANVDVRTAATRGAALDRSGCRCDELRDARTGSADARVRSIDLAAARSSCGARTRVKSCCCWTAAKWRWIRETLLITDANGPIAIAGVMGGERSGISATTRDVFLECAFFAPRAIAGTARRYGLQTDASQRFERGVDHGSAVHGDGTRDCTADRDRRWANPVRSSTPFRPHICLEPRYVALRQSRLDLYVGEATDVGRGLERLCAAGVSAAAEAG